MGSFWREKMFGIVLKREVYGVILEREIYGIIFEVGGGFSESF